MEDYVTKVIYASWYGNTVLTWSIATGLALLVFSALFVIRFAGARRAHRHAARGEAGLLGLIDQLVVRTHLLFLLAVSLYAGTTVLDLPARLDTITHRLVMLVVLLQVALWGDVLVRHAIASAGHARAGEEAVSSATVSILGFLGRLAVWSFVVLVALDNFGFNISALLAGLGIGGVAAALAAQNILGDLFASISIALDKPFAVGDFIVVGDMMGTVEYVGIKTTRVRSLGGEQLVFSNNDLLQSRIRNFKRMAERRVVFTLGVTYQTPAGELAEIPGMLREIISRRTDVRFDRAHFARYGDFALEFEVVYYVLSADYNAYMDAQQAINLEIFSQFEARGIEFAYPTQTVFVQQAAGGAGPA